MSDGRGSVRDGGAVEWWSGVAWKRSELVRGGGSTPPRTGVLRVVELE